VFNAIEHGEWLLDHHVLDEGNYPPSALNGGTDFLLNVPGRVAAVSQENQQGCAAGDCLSDLVSDRPTWLNVAFCQVGMEADCLHLSRNPLDGVGVGARVAEEHLRR
jgi:hypothetical protein